MRRALLALALSACCAPALPAAEDGPLTPEKAKALIPEAAGLPAGVFEKVTDGDPGKFRPPQGDTLTWLVFTYVPGPGAPENPTSFKYVGENPNPAAVARAIAGPKGKDGKARTYASVIHPEYITDCTCKADGDTATGTVTFKADKAYEGKVEYTARKKDGAWRVEEFRLPDLKITTTLGTDGKWVKK
jgi:hypothetical protein